MDIIGRKVRVNLPELGGFNLPAKVDTGAFRTAIHCEWAEIKIIENKETLCVQLNWGEGPIPLEFSSFQKRIIKNSFGQAEERFCVKTLIVIGGKRIRSDISFSRRKGMKYPILVGRKTIGKKFLIDVSKGF